MARYLEMPEPVLWARVRNTTDEIADLFTVFIRGDVQAGVWKEAVENDPADWELAPVAADARYRGIEQYGLRVRGPSMNVLYPEGSVVICVSLIALGRDPRPGERVICLRRSEQGFEATVKEFRVDDHGKYWLWPRSTDPNFQTPWPLFITNDFAAENEDLRLVGLVIASHRPEG